jgi:hypothetical protein
MYRYMPVDKYPELLAGLGSLQQQGSLQQNLEYFHSLKEMSYILLVNVSIHGYLRGVAQKILSKK